MLANCWRILAGGRLAAALCWNGALRTSGASPSRNSWRNATALEWPATSTSRRPLWWPVWWLSTPIETGKCALPREPGDRRRLRWRALFPALPHRGGVLGTSRFDPPPVPPIVEPPMGRDLQAVWRPAALPRSPPRPFVPPPLHPPAALLHRRGSVPVQRPLPSSRLPRRGVKDRPMPSASCLPTAGPSLSPSMPGGDRMPRRPSGPPG